MSQSLLLKYEPSVGMSNQGWNACWSCVGLAVLHDVVSWVRFSSEENFSGRGDFSLGVNKGPDSIPQKFFWMRV